jgi:hypothetical protein
MLLGDRTNAASLALYNAQQVDMIASRRIAADKSFILHPPQEGRLSLAKALSYNQIDVTEYLPVS